MKKILYVFLLLALGFTACEEEDLQPSGADRLPAKEQPDMSRPLIARYRNDFNVSIVYRFVDSTDYKFTFGDENSIKLWKHVQVKNYDTTTVDYGLKMLDSLILQYFKDEVSFNGENFKPDFKKMHFPRCIYLADSLGGEYSKVYHGLEDLNMKESEHYFSYIWNGFEPMFAFNEGYLSEASTTKILKYRNSALHCFLMTLFWEKRIYREFPAELFEGVQDLYNKSVKDLAIEENAPINKVGFRNYAISPNWYMSKGFAMTNRFPKGRYSSYSSWEDTEYDKCLDTLPRYQLYFPTIEKDLSSMFHVIVCERDAANIRSYFKEEAILRRMRILIRELYMRGIDVFAINPAMKEFFNE